MSVDFFGKKPEKFGIAEYKESLSSNLLSFELYVNLEEENYSFVINIPLPVWLSTWIYNYCENYLQARWPRNDHCSLPAWCVRPMMRFDVFRPLHHGSYDYAHEFFCATIYPVKSLFFAIKSLFFGFMSLDICEALCSIAEVCVALMFICYSILTSCLGIIIRPLISIPMACEKIIDSLTLLIDDTSKTEHVSNGF